MPDDIWFEDMDPLLKIYMYEQWCQDKDQEYDLGRSLAILVGSFTNPEAAKKMLDKGGHDNETVLSDEDFEASSKMVMEQEKTPKKRRRRRKING